ncbi:hypothetical protein [Chroococcidiopsis thermalis]|nr:hypothetical protein [Chroococcidiopsis thermalis]
MGTRGTRKQGSRGAGEQRSDNQQPTTNNQQQISHTLHPFFTDN